MHQKTLLLFREKIRLRQYVMTLHAFEEMEDDGFSIFDVERAILTGTIVEKQKDQNSGENKFLVKGTSIRGEFMITVGKIGATDRLIIITVYRE